MTDTTWRDVYGDAEGLACELDLIQTCEEIGRYDKATDIHHAATAIREQAAEIERLQLDGIHTCHDRCPRTACVLRRRVVELQERLDWQPIETAPRDGTRIIIQWGGVRCVGFFLDNSTTRLPWSGFRTLSGELTPQGQPTHWRAI